MVGKKEIKFIKSLRNKKFRINNNCFVVEGKKSVNEFLKSDYKLVKLYTVSKTIINIDKQEVIDKNLLEKISFLKNPDDYLAIFEFTKPTKIRKNNFIVALDSVSDPGNLGTIIRTCEWFGVNDIICSLNTVDCYSPKVIQSAMGSVSRVNISYLDLKKYFEDNKSCLVGTSLNGNSIYDLKKPIKKGVIVFGNESHGVSSKLQEMMNIKIKIPKYNKSMYPESLNLATSVGIVLSKLMKIS
ncbi:MAG: RNA methyltransferase [Flavobacteriales bacterium]|nr:RNA methyltransferase [Flavobacteriales bacterium]|tara:strand:- start:358 stop:1083 length:726 start_codon:yes stop_codon:yes gene_type:complete